jgi:hypothetical protein
MMRYLPALSLLLLLPGCVPHPLDCSRFRNGKFKSTLHGHPYFVERYGSFQTEYLVGAKDSMLMTFTVDWLNDYTYTLHPTPATLKKYPKIKPGEMVTVQIIHITPNSYTVRAERSIWERAYVEEFTKAD